MVTSLFRTEILQEVASINAMDDVETSALQDAMQWIDSGVELCRLEKPDTPKKHLVAYFPVIDGDYLLLVDHINAELWLPTGGHVEPGEHPRATVQREAMEELSLQAEFLTEAPVLMTSTITVGRTAGHTDVSLWYAIKGDRRRTMQFDQTEFNEIRWFHRDALPYDRTDPELSRFVEKFYAQLAGRVAKTGEDACAEYGQGGK